MQQFIKKAFFLLLTGFFLNSLGFADERPVDPLAEFEGTFKLPKHEPHSTRDAAIGTEAEIFLISPLIKDSPEGLFVSVGGERSFRGASMANATGLLVLDYSPTVLRFARINRELLKAKDLDHYNRLRFTSSYEEWVAFQENTKPQQKLTKKDHQLWQGYNSDIFGFNLKAKVNEGSMSSVKSNPKLEKYLPSSFDFKTANYLMDSELFEKLHKLAIQEKIYVIPMDLKDAKLVKSLTYAIQKSNHKIGVLDLNNLFSPDYIGYEAYFELVPKFLELGNPDSILLIMSIIRILKPNGAILGDRHFYATRKFSFLREISDAKGLSEPAFLDPLAREFQAYESRIKPQSAWSLVYALPLAVLVIYLAAR